MLQSKEFLRNIKTETLEIKLLQLKRDGLYSALMPKGIQYKSVDVQESGPSDSMAEKFGEIYELEKIIEGRIQELIRKNSMAHRMINELKDPRHRIVLEMYYLDMKRVTWEDIAREMGYSYREIQRFHGNALMELEKIMKEAA